LEITFFWRIPFIHPLFFIFFAIVFVPVDFGFIVDVRIGPLA
jgi:hypothetical protein